jgi:hypothetical protein
MRRVRSFVAFVGLFAAGLVPFANSSLVTARAAPNSPHMTINCEYGTCAEVANPAEVFGTDSYVGHDEPSAVFYSSKPGAGNRMSYSVTLPNDPSPTNPASKSYQFQLNGAIWFGLALCDTQSYPEQVATCPADSDRNIANNPNPKAPDYIGRHSGSGFLELQFYPPGWVPWPTWAVALGASSCDPTKWCAAVNIFGLLENPFTGQLQNSTCVNNVLGSPEYVNFAFVTKNGKPHASPNPVDATLDTFTPHPGTDLFMNSGDNLGVSMHDTANGLRININDQTSGENGSMTLGAANGFAQIQYDPTGTSCNAIPYNFHPMYSTSSEETRVIWAAHTYNVSQSNEIGHFETCTGPAPIPATPFGLDASGNIVNCPSSNVEERGAEPTDRDDYFCFPASEALRIHVAGCTGQNNGFDSLDYQTVWPDGNTRLHPQPFLFSTPLTGEDYNVNYQRIGFEADLPRIEANTCNRSTGAGCFLRPITDDGQPVAFYPYFSAVGAGRGNASGLLASSEGSGCMLGFGSTLPNTINNFGGLNGYGSLLFSVYLAFGGGGSTVVRTNNFRQVFSNNPCPATGGGGDNGGGGN